jgi:hypothetical protein
MKKIVSFIFFILLLFSYSSDAGIIMRTRGAGGCDDCSGDLKFSWHMEALDITSGSPCGCVDSGGDTVATEVNGGDISSTQKSDGTYSSYSPDGSDYHKFDSSGGDNFDDAEGKIVIDIYVDTFVADAYILRIDDGGATDRLLLDLRNSSVDIQIRASWTGSNPSQASDYATTAANGYHGEDEWLRITYQWKQSESNADHYLQVCDLTPPDTIGNCSEAAAQDDINLWADDATDFIINNGNTPAAAMYVDNIEVYATSGL